MNWLAHLLLSEPTPEFRIGNLLPDLLTPLEMRDLSARFLPGVQRHRLIDFFTDTHPTVRLSRSRLPPPYRRCSGIIIDVFYDHFLAEDWQQHSNAPLEDFVMEVYEAIQCCLGEIPAGAHERLRAMIAGNWLVRYRELDGIRHALERLGQRLRQPVNLGSAVDFLEEDRAGLHGDFREFFPALMAHTELPAQ